MPAGKRNSPDDDIRGAARYWRVRTALEIAKFTVWLLWETIKHRF